MKQCEQAHRMVDKPATADLVDQHLGFRVAFDLRVGFYAPSYPITLLRRTITNKVEDSL